MTDATSESFVRARPDRAHLGSVVRPVHVLTFTRHVERGRQRPRRGSRLLVAAIGCNIAWGFVDGVMYVLRNLIARARKATLMRAVRDAAEPAQAHRIIGQEIGDVARVLGAAEFERMRRWIVDRPASASAMPGVTGRATCRGRSASSSWFPVDLPGGAALRLHRRPWCGQARIGCGRDRHAPADFAWGRHAGLKAWRTGLVMVLLGVAVEAVVIALGG